MDKMKTNKMRKGEKVKWTDPVTRKVRVGILQERDFVTDAAKAHKDGSPREFNPVNEFSWTVAEWETGKPVAIRERDLTKTK